MKSISSTNDQSPPKLIHRQKVLLFIMEGNSTNIICNVITIGAIHTYKATIFTSIRLILLPGKPLLPFATCIQSCSYEKSEGLIFFQLYHLHCEFIISISASHTGLEWVRNMNWTYHCNPNEFPYGIGWVFLIFK